LSGTRSNPALAIWIIEKEPIPDSYGLMARKLARRSGEAFKSGRVNNEIEIIRNNGDLKRERWVFNFIADWNYTVISLNTFVFETRDSKRHKWKYQSRYERSDTRIPISNIPKPNIPLNIQEEVKDRICFNVRELNING